MNRLKAVMTAALLALAGCDEASPPAPVGKPALWQVEDGTGTPVAWLFGTIHLLPKGAKWRTPVLDRSITQAGTLVVEVRDLSPDAIAPIFQSLARPCACPPLSERIAPEDRAELRELIDEAGLPRNSLDRTETWAAALTLASVLGAKDAAPGADVAVIEAFGQRPVLELEGAADQLAIFDRLPEAAQRTMLGAVVEENAQDDADSLAKAWLRGDTEAIAEETREGMMADPAIYAALLRNRNADWAAKLARWIADGKRPFVAVGAAHIVGPHGLAATLAAQGLTVRRIQ